MDSGKIHAHAYCFGSDLEIRKMRRINEYPETQQEQEILIS
jgi:hypothetical protein